MKKQKIFNILGYIFLCTLFLIISPFILPKFFGFEPYGILTDSMEPAYPVGSIIYVSEVDPTSLQKGDVITFRLGVASDAVATHRVVLHDQEKKQLITKGDKNADVDASPVVYDRLVGKVVTCIPFLGTFYQWLTSMVGIMMCTFLFLMTIVVWLIGYHMKNNGK